MERIDNTFFIRYPKLSLRNIFDLLEKNVAEDDFKKAVKENLQDGNFRDALKYSSPLFYLELIKQDCKNEISEKTYATLYKYFSRASSRAIPLDMFSVISFGNIEGQTNLCLNNDKNKFYEHINIQVLYILNEFLLDNEKYYQALMYSINSTVFFEGTYLKYFIFKDGENELKVIKNSKFLSSFITDTTVPISYNSIIEYFKNVFPNNTIMEVSSYINSLIKSKLLIATTTPSYIDNYSLESFLGKINIDSLQNTEKSLLIELKKHHDESISKNDYSKIKDFLVKEFKDNLTNVQSTRIDIVSVGSKFTISETLASQIVNSISKLNFLRFNVIDNAKVVIDEFITNFKKKYHEGDLVPLTKIFDPERGNSLFTNHNKITSLSSEQVYLNLRFNNFYSHILNYCKYNQDDHYVISEEDLVKFNDLSIGQKNCSPNFGIFGSMLRIDEVYEFHLKSSNDFPSSKNYSRFTPYFKDYAQKFEESNSFESEYFEGAILAEIYYLPPNDLSNISKRFLERSYFINLNQAKTGCDNEICISDILMTVQEGKIKIFSKSNKKEIIPVRTSPNVDLPNFDFYNILNLISDQYKKPALIWDWNSYTNEPFLPKISYNGIILAERMWNFSLFTIQKFLKKNEISHNDLADYLNSLNISSYVLLKLENDKKLLIHTKHNFCIKLLLSHLLKYKYISLEDFSDYRASELDYYNEILITAKNIEKNVSQYSLLKFREDEPDTKPKIHSIGNKWISLVIKGNERILEKLLVGDLARIILKLKSASLIKEINFLRFGGDNSLLKLRIKVKNKQNVLEVLNTIKKPIFTLIGKGDLDDCIYDNYIPDYNRYGKGDIKSVQKLFNIDSILTLRILKKKRFTTYSERWNFTILSVFNYLQLIDGSVEQYEYIKYMKSVLFEEYEKDDPVGLRIQLNNLYRNRKNSILNTFKSDVYNYQFFNNWKHEIKQIKIDRENIMHCIHMFVNRFFPKDQRIIELQIFHCLEKYLLSTIKQK